MHNRLNKNKYLRKSTLPAMGLLVLGGASAAALAKSANFDTKIEIQDTSKCGFEVTQSGDREANVTYDKRGTGWRRGKLNIIGNPVMTVTISATGASLCDLPRLRMRTFYPNSFGGAGGMKGIILSGGNGYFPMFHAFSRIELRSSEGELTDGILYPTRSSKRVTEEIVSEYSQKKIVNTDSFRGLTTNSGEAVDLQWQGEVIGDMRGPFTLTHMITNYPEGSTDERASPSIKPNRGTRTAIFDIKPIYGSDPINLKTHKIDNTVIGDGEELKATAIMTVTAE
ncbi:TPA: hypothetical protein ACS72K_003920 [Providencia alcalifaciens]